MFGKKTKKNNVLKSKKKKSINSPSFKMPDFSKVKAITDNPRNQYLAGVILLCISSFLLFSFGSYLLNWKVDQDKIQHITNVVSDASGINEISNNQGGTLGAKISHFFIHELFGIASFSIPFLFIIYGVRLSFKRALLPLASTTKIVLFYGLLSSLVLSLIFEKAEFNPGGVVGLEFNNFLSLWIGKSGLIAIISLSLIISLLYFFNIRIDEVLANLFKAKDLEEDLEENPEKAVANEVASNQESIELQPSVEVVENNILSQTEVQNTVTPVEEITKKESATNDGGAIDLSPTSPPPPKKEKAPDEEVSLEIEETKEKDEEPKDLPNSKENYDPTLDLSSYKFPILDLLEDFPENTDTKVTPETLEENKNNIVNTLRNYKIEIESIKASIGPTVTLYEIVPAAGIRISKIKNLEDDIALSLAALGIRIIAPIPGKGTIGIEVPNPNPDIVAMKTVLASNAFNNSGMDLPIALGKTISNETYVVDLAKMPHLLMAGATGQGKSVGLNCILVSLLYKKHPSQLKLVLVDPKKVELTLFNKVVRHFLAKLPDAEEAIITETTKVVNTVNSLCIEMDQRYELLKEAHCRNLKEYNKKFVERKLNPEKGHRFLPYIVLVVDEFADLIMTAGKEVETPIARLAQLARAIGIHLIIATQRPSVNIITGTIKANFPARIAFRVTSKIDSRTILDAGGADQLIGRGDMLLSTGNDLTRIQCAFVDTPEVEKICEFIGEQRGYPDAHLLPEYNDGKDSEGGANIALEDRDALFEDAARVVVAHQQGSASLLQRKLKLGYNRAGRIVDQLEAAGIIGPFEGSKARQVLIPDEHSLEQFLNYNDEEE